MFKHNKGKSPEQFWLVLVCFNVRVGQQNPINSNYVFYKTEQNPEDFQFKSIC